MNPNLKKTVAVGLFFLLSAFIIFLSETYLFDYTQKQIEHYQYKLFKDSYKSGLLAFFKFDEPDVDELLWKKKNYNYGTVLRNGKINSGRFFNGSDKTYIDTQVYWEALGDQYTISLWVKLEKKNTQSIIFLQNGKLGSGIMLLDRNIIFQVPSNKSNQICSYKFSKYGEFVHLTGVADLKTKKAYLYENGKLKSTISISDIEHTGYPIQFGKFRPLKVYHPLHGVLDETSLWRKALNKKEIRKIYNSKTSYWKKISFKCFFKLSLFKTLNAFFQTIAISFDILNPFYHEAKVFKSNIPEFNFMFSKNDIKYLNKYQNSTLQNGYLDWEDVGDKKAKLIWENKVQPIAFKYYGRNSKYWSNTKKSFYIEMQSDVYPMKMKKILFTPPEIKGFLKPCLWRTLSNKYESTDIKNGYAIVRINSKFMGVFFFEEFLVDGYLDYNEESNIQDIIGTINYPEEEVVQIYESLKRKYLPVFLNDKTISLSKKEIKYYINKDEKDIKRYFKENSNTRNEIIDKIYNYISYEKILGDNFANDYVTSDLNLNLQKIPNIQVEWQTTNSKVISIDGKIDRSNIIDSVDVTLKCRLSGFGISKTKRFYFKVFSKHNLIPVLKIDVPSNKIVNSHKVQSVVELIDPVSMKSSGKYASSIKLRGNTALYYDKKSYSVKTDRVHNYFDFSNTKRFNLMGVAPDKTFMHNKLIYDLFRTLSKEGSFNEAPKIHWVDLFINNQYKGLYEISEKVDIFSLRMKQYQRNERYHSVIYKACGAHANFRIPLKRSYVQKYPKSKDQEYWQPFTDLISFIGSAPKKKFIRDFTKKMNLNNIMDFHIIVNFSYNKDGVNHNLFLCRNNKKNDPFFIVPWDYDKSFGLSPSLWLSNFLFDRLKNEYPGYKENFLNHWKYLRKNKLSLKSLLARIDSMEKTLRGRAKYNFKLYKFENHETIHIEEVDKLKKWVKQRLNHMDKIIEDNFS